MARHGELHGPALHAGVETHGAFAAPGRSMAFTVTHTIRSANHEGRLSKFDCTPPHPFEATACRPIGSSRARGRQ